MKDVLFHKIVSPGIRIIILLHVVKVFHTMRPILCHTMIPSLKDSQVPSSWQYHGSSNVSSARMAHNSIYVL